MLAFSFIRRGQDAAQQAESRHLEDGKAAQTALACAIGTALVVTRLDRSATLGVPAPRKGSHSMLYSFWVA
jgi:hypothetical protein